MSKESKESDKSKSSEDIQEIDKNDIIEETDEPANTRIFHSIYSMEAFMNVTNFQNIIDSQPKNIIAKIKPPTVEQGIKTTLMTRN